MISDTNMLLMIALYLNAFNALYNDFVTDAWRVSNTSMCMNLTLLGVSAVLLLHIAL